MRAKSQLTNLSFFRCIRSILKARFAANVRNRQASATPDSLDEDLQAEIIAAGNRLLVAMKLEARLRGIDVTAADAETLAEWKMCRKAVEILTDDYVAAMRRWRENTEDNPEGVLQSSLVVSADGVVAWKT